MWLLGIALLLTMACTVAEGPEDFPKQRCTASTIFAGALPQGF